MKKSLKILLVIVLIIAVLIGGYFGYIQIMKGQATKTIDRMFTALKSGDENQISEFINIDNEDDDSDQSEGAEMEKIMLKNLKYEVTSFDYNFSKCTANLKITNKDLKKVFQNYMTKAISLAFSQANEDMSDDDVEDELKRYFEEQYDSEAIDEVSTELTVELIRENGKWKINCDDNALVDAILPGYREFIEYVNDFEGEE